MKLTCYTLEPPESLPELAPGGPDRDWMDDFADRHPYRCLPLVIANTTGWAILSPCSFTAMWTGGPQMEDIKIFPDDDWPHLERFAKSHFTKGVLTFHTGYLFRTDPGWDMWVGGAPNHTKDGIVALTGIVETSWLPFPFTMNWRFTRPGYVQFTKGEPFCFIMPVPHSGIENVQPVVKSIHDDPKLKAEFEAWGYSRASFLEKLAAMDPDTVQEGWQKHYFKGQKVEGEKPADFGHINRRRLKPPRPAGEGE